MKMRMDERLEEEEEEERTSECSSGCQSGWTMYLDHSNEELNSLPLHKAISVEEEEEEDLSMVSDASSGPPHFHEEEHENYCNCRSGCFCSASSAVLADNYKKRRVEVESSPFLNDTANSFFLSKTAAANTTNNNMNKKKATKDELSCGFSATHFKGKPGFKRHLGYSQSSSTPVKPRTVCRVEGEKKLR